MGGYGFGNMVEGGGPKYLSIMHRAYKCMFFGNFYLDSEDL